MQSPNALEGLIIALRGLPGIGPKSAQRIAYHLLQRNREGAKRLAEALFWSLDNLVHCERCNNFSEEPVCRLCLSTKRDQSLLCVVETPVDMNMMEQTQAYSGLYYVLMGRISPLDGIGPRELGLDKFSKRINDGAVKEIIVATNYTNEGEVTAHFLGEMIKNSGIKVTRIARGVPVGGELEFVDLGTLAQAVRERKRL